VERGSVFSACSGTDAGDGVSNLEQAIEAIFPVNEMPCQPCTYRNAGHGVGIPLAAHTQVCRCHAR
jgi:hypothetical protein